MKIIFLDVDGVLNTRMTTDYCGQFIGIEDAKLLQLKKIIDETGAKVVLSSTWRLGYNKDGKQLDKCSQYLKDKFDKAGIEIYDVTPDIGHSLRHIEIKQWLTEHEDIESYVILDDEEFDFYRYDIGEHLVLTDWFCVLKEEAEKCGLTDEKVRQAIEILHKVEE